MEGEFIIPRCCIMHNGPYNNFLEIIYVHCVMNENVLGVNVLSFTIGGGLFNNCLKASLWYFFFVVERNELRWCVSVIFIFILSYWFCNYKRKSRYDVRYTQMWDKFRIPFLVVCLCVWTKFGNELCNFGIFRVGNTSNFD